MYWILNEIRMIIFWFYILFWCCYYSLGVHAFYRSVFCLSFCVRYVVFEYAMCVGFWTLMYFIIYYGIVFGHLEQYHMSAWPSFKTCRVIISSIPHAHHTPHVACYVPTPSHVPYTCTRIIRRSLAAWLVPVSYSQSLINPMA